MRRAVALVLGAALVAGCTQPLERGTRDLGMTSADLQRLQVRQNIARIAADFHALPSQYELGTGSTQSSQTASGATGVDFRGIAVTGFTASGSQSIVQNFGITPVIGVTDLRLLQLLYQYAVNDRRNPGPTEFPDLAQELGRVARGVAAGAGRARATHFVDTLTEVIGSLPPAPLVLPGASCGPGHGEVIEGHCFVGGRATETRFILWISAVTQEISLPPEDSRRPARRDRAGRSLGEILRDSQPQPGVRIQRRPDSLAVPRIQELVR